MTPHHVGYLVRSIDGAVREMQALGYRQRADVVYDAIREIDVCFMEHGGLCVELVSPRGKESVVAGLMKKLGPSPYHICYLVEDVEKTAAELAAGSYVLMGEIQPAPALHASPAAFLFNRQIGMIELIEHE